MTNIVIPDKVTSIEAGAFMQSGLTNISIPESVTNIVEDAFAYCDNLVANVYKGSYAETWCDAHSVKYVWVNALPVGNHGNCGYTCSVKLKDFDGCGYSWTSDGMQYTCDGSCYNHYTNYGYVKHCEMIAHSSTAYAADHDGRSIYNQTIEMWQECTGSTIVPPTCTENGYSLGTCIYCNATHSGKYSTISATGHTEVVIPGRTPTNTMTGLTDGKMCITCGMITIEQEIIPCGTE